MPISVDAPSWFSAIRADDKPVYLNREGTIKTGGSLKGRLVDIAESLGIFKDYVTDYREREAVHNRDAYAAAWRFVANKYGMTVRHHTQQTMQEKGYSRVDRYAGRLQGRDASDPQRAVVGRELRLILDTARGANEALWGADVAQQQYTGSAERSDAEVAAQRQRWAIWTGSGGGGAEVATLSGTETMETVSASESSGNADGIAESLQDMNMSAEGLGESAETRGREAAEVGNKPTQVPRELGRAMVAGNKERLHQMLGSETQLRVLAQELGYDPKNIASRQSYILGKLGKRLETDPRAKSGKLTRNEIYDLARSVFDKALGKSTMVAGIRGAVLGASSKVKHALAEDNSDQVDVLELSKDKIKIAARDRTYLKKLMAERLGTHDQEVDPARIAHIEHLAIKEATARVREAKVELSSAEVDDVLVHSLRTSFEVGQYEALLKGGFGKASRAVKPEFYGLKRSVADVLEKAADENPQVLVEAADERAEALHEVQQQPEQPGKTSSPAVDESVTSPPQHQDSLQPAAVAASSPASLPQVSLPKPQRYKGVDYFDQSVREIRELGIPVRNHQAAKQAVADDRYLAASVPEGHSGNELTPARRKYIETTLLRHVAEHERTKPGTPLDAGDLHRMMKPITARALGIQNDRVLGAKVWYKNVTKHLGHKDTAFGDGLKKLRRNARDKANSKAGLPSFVRDAARKANIAIDIDHRVLRTIRPQVKDMAEAYVNEHRKVLTDAELENFVQIALSGYSLVAVHSPMRDFKW